MESFVLFYLMLLFPVFLFFYKMGWIIITVVLFALAWALIFFSSIALMWGPEGDQGDLNKYLVHCPCKQCKEKPESEAKAAADGDKKEGNGVELTTQA